MFTHEHAKDLNANMC